ENECWDAGHKHTDCTAHHDLEPKREFELRTRRASNVVINSPISPCPEGYTHACCNSQEDEHQLSAFHVPSPAALSVSAVPHSGHAPEPEARRSYAHA